MNANWKYKWVDGQHVKVPTDHAEYLATRPVSRRPMVEDHNDTGPRALKMVLEPPSVAMASKAKLRQKIDRVGDMLARAVDRYRTIECIPLPGDVPAYTPRPSPRDIIRQVAKDHGFTYNDIVGVRRHRALIEPRFLAIRAVADARPDMSLTAIGHAFRRDHTTILHSLRKTAAPAFHDYRSGRTKKEGVPPE